MEGLGLFFSSTVINQMIRFFEFVFALLMLMYLNLKLTFYAISILPAYYVVIRAFSLGLVSATKDVLEGSANIMGKIQEKVSGVEVVRLFGTEEREAEEVKKEFKGLARKNLLQSIFFTIFGELNFVIIALGGLLILWVGGMDIIKGSFTIGSYLAFVGYLQKLYGPIQSMATFSLSLYPAFVSLQRVSEILEAEKEKEGNIELKNLIGDIQFKNISFSYDGEKKVLEGIDLHIKPGEKVVILGPNGSGKSTLIKLLLGMYDPLEGEIVIDGIDIKDIKLSSLREKIGIVSQNVFLFNDSVRNNVAYAIPQVKDEEIINLLKTAELYDIFMEGFKDGLNTIIGERGAKISGGQKKIIAFLRAVLKKPHVLILDEATSEVDMTVERKIYEYIEKFMRDKTCIIISHIMLQKF